MEHLQEYDFALSQYLGVGCGMTYRGDKLYDAEGDASYNLVRVVFHQGMRCCRHAFMVLVIISMYFLRR